MPEVVIGFDKQIADFVCAQMPDFYLNTVDGWYAGLGVVHENELVAGIIYHEFRGVDVRCSIAAIKPTWASRKTLAQILGYGFDILGVRRITAITEKQNKKSQHMLRRLGFKYEGNCRKAMADGKDAILYGMLKEECKWRLQKEKD